MDHDASLLNSVVLPLMNVDRRMANGELDETEPTQAQLYITSAGTKGTFAYERACEMMVQSIVNPKSTFTFSCDYRIPQMHGLLNKQFVDELKLSSTFDENSFAKEYMSIWSGGSEDSWIDYDKMSRYRTLMNPEKHKNLRGNNEIFYVIGIDVARVGVLTSIHVAKVIPQQDHFRKNIVYSLSLHNMHFAKQSIEVKKLYAAFEPKEIIIDRTGIGVGIMDFLVQDQWGEDGVFYPALVSYNDEDYSKYNGIKVINCLLANASVNSQAHSNFYSQISNGHVRFLISEQEAKTRLMATKIGQKMRPLDRLERLTPHIETTKLFEEVGNLKIKMNSSENIAVEQVNKRINKDRFSSLEYLLLAIKPMEEEYYKRKYRKARDVKKFLLFN